MIDHHDLAVRRQLSLHCTDINSFVIFGLGRLQSRLGYTNERSKSVAVHIVRAASNKDEGIPPSKLSPEKNGIPIPEVSRFHLSQSLQF